MWMLLNTIGAQGSESGIILLDEEANLGARITTLEQCKDYYAITVGIYGSMVHTLFCDKESCHVQYQKMKQDIQDFLEKDTTEAEDIEFYKYFTDLY